MFPLTCSIDSYKYMAPAERQMAEERGVGAGGGAVLSLYMAVVV